EIITFGQGVYHVVPRFGQPRQLPFFDVNPSAVDVDHGTLGPVLAKDGMAERKPGIVWIIAGHFHGHANMLISHNLAEVDQFFAEEHGANAGFRDLGERKASLRQHVGTGLCAYVRIGGMAEVPIGIDLSPNDLPLIKNMFHGVKLSEYSEKYATQDGECVPPQLM